MQLKPSHPKKSLRSVLLVLLLFAAGITNLWASFDFSAIAPSGQTMYYRITNNINKDVSLTYPGYYYDSPWQGYNKPTGNLIIPFCVEYNGELYTVSEIGAHAFENCSGLTTISIPNSIVSIGAYAFDHCNGLIGELIIPNSVCSIDSYAFSSCRGLNSIVISNSVSRIGSSVFSYCENLISIIIPSSVVAIGSDAFRECGRMTSVVIPYSVTSIGGGAFYKCSNLTEIISLNPQPPTITVNCFGDVNKNIPVYIPIGSTSAYQSATIWSAFNNFVEVVSCFSATCSTGQTLYYAVTDVSNHYVEVVYPGNSSAAPWEGYDQPSGNLVIPETVEYQGITYTVKGIGSQAFYGCTGLTQVTISANIDYVYAKAFWNCPNLETVYFNAVNCGLMQTRTGSGTSTSPYTYYSVFSSDETGSAPNLTRVSIGSGVQNIPDYAFKNAEDVYQRLVIPASVTNIGNYAFYGCNSMVQMVIQGSGLQTIGNYAFYGCSALQTALNLPNSVVSLGSYSFYGCTHIPSLTIGESMASIGNSAFWNCPAMVTVNFNAVNCTNMKTQTGTGTNANPYVDYSVFNCGTEAGGTTPITTLNIGPNVTNIPNYAFYNSPNATNNLVFPEGLLNIGQYAFYDGGFTGELVVPGMTESVGQYAFYNCNDISSITLGSGEIGQYAFNSCDEITSLIIGEGVTSVGGKAFWDCPQLQTVNFNAINCTTMNTDGAYSVFNEGSSNGGETPITTLTIGNNVTNIPNYAFYNSPNATNTLPLPNGLLNIGTYAFYNCSGMTGALTIPNTVTNVGQYAFYHCSGFDGSLALSNSLSTINPYTFCGCTGFIETLSIPNSVLTIAEHAFEDCSSFTGPLVIHDAMTSIGEAAFKGCSNIAELTLGEGLSTIGGSAFWNCPQMHTVHFNPVNCTTMNTSNAYSVFNVGTTSSGATPIVTLTIGENVTRIPDYAFRNSISATSKIVIPNATTYIGTYAFYGFRSNELTIGEGVDEIGGYAFWYCPNLQTVHFNAIDCSSMKTQTGSGSNIVYYSVFNSGTNSVSSPSITLLTIGKKVQTIPDYAFKNCSSADCKLLFPNTLTTIGVQAFYEGNSFIGDLVIPNSVTSLGEYAFYHCNGFDGSLVIGSGISTINPYTFADCTGFSGALIIGRSVESIGNYSFRNCSGFSTAISEHPTPPTALNTSFNNMNYAIPVHVPYAMVPAYQAATGWSLFSYFREQFVFDQLDNDLWSDTQNWYSFELPTANDVVCVNSNCQMDMDAEVLHLYVLNLNDALTINNGENLSVTYGIGTLQPSQLIIADGGQLVNPVSNAYGTVQRNINGYGSGTDGWYSLGTPIYEGTETNTLTTGSYDLFYYDEPSHYWMNEKIADNGLVSLEPSQGYLYANQAQQTIAFAGQINASNAEFILPVTYEGSPLAGYTFLGNPYTNNLSIGDVKLNDTPLTTYYRIEGVGSLVAYTVNDPIRPGEGFLVMAPEGGTIAFTPSQSQGRKVNMTENQDDGGPARGFRIPEHGDMTNINAYSSEIACTITATANPAEGGTVTGAGTFDQDATCTLVATANEGYNFVNWTENGNQVSTEANYTFTVHGNRTLVANFVSNLPNNYTITATASPVEGGSVTGSGTYAAGQNCTLTATANSGYVFGSWTENGEAVSTNATYSFTVSVDRTLVAHFAESGNYWEPEIEEYEDNMTLTCIVQLDGVEQATTMLELGAFCGTECRGSQRATYFAPTDRYIFQMTVFGENNDVISFRLYDHQQNQELLLSPPAPITFIANGYGSLFNPYVLNFTSMVEHTQALNSGWNWWSTYIELTDNNGLSQLENSLGNAGILIKSRTNGYVEAYQYNGETNWYGTLSSINNEQMYKIRTNAACNATIAGMATMPSNHPISIKNGWNWIGFPCNQNVSVDVAMSGFTPEANDVIKGRNGFTTYYSDGNYNMWYGTLNTLEPGKGYMYRSNSTTQKTLVFQTGRGEATTENVTTENNYFQPVGGDFADNMTITAVLELDGEELRSEDYELAAFVGDECRGSVRLMYVEPIDKYVAFLVVFGEPAETLHFTVTDGTQTELSMEEIAFEADGMVGSLAEPKILCFGTTRVDENELSKVLVYPNPSNGVFNIQGQGIRKIEVFNAFGQAVVSEETSNDHLQIDLSRYAEGCYMLRVVTDNGISNCQLIKK